MKKTITVQESDMLVIDFDRGWNTNKSWHDLSAIHQGKASPKLC